MAILGTTGRVSSEGSETIRAMSKHAQGSYPHDWEEKSEGQEPVSSEKQDPFAGEAREGRTSYNTMEWWQAGLVMIADTISLGILSLPSVLATVGFAPGMILILGLGVLATYTGYTLGQFKLRYPHIQNMADAGEVLFAPLGAGAIGREVFGAAQLILLIFGCGSHVLTFAIMMNTLTNHGTCSIVFGVVGAILQFIFSMPRTLKKMSYLAIASFVSIIAAVMITMIGVGIEKPDTLIRATRTADFARAFSSVTNIIFAYAGHVAFFGFMSELKDPRDYRKALLLLQGVDTTMYLIVASIIYAYAGDSVASPALGSASPVVAKVAYGIAIPTIIIAGVINGHVAAKFMYVRLYRGTDFMTEKSFRSYGMWFLLLAIVWILAWIIAEAIPVFNDLLGIISALFVSWFTYGLSGIFWLFLNWGNYTRTGRKLFLTVVNFIILGVGIAIFGIGLYASGTAIHADASRSGASFSCADSSK